MRREATMIVTQCDRIGCHAVWRLEKGRPEESARYRGAARCEKLGADFCGSSCHTSAHASEAHGARWRRKQALRALKRSPR